MIEYLVLKPLDTWNTECLSKNSLCPSRYDNSNDACFAKYGNTSVRLGGRKHTRCTTACSRYLKNSLGYMKEDAFNDQGTQEGNGANHPSAQETISATLFKSDKTLSESSL